MLPAVPPTGRPVVIPIVAVIGMRNGLIDSEHIYWDQASVLAQIGLLDPVGLPNFVVLAAAELAGEVELLVETTASASTAAATAASWPSRTAGGR